LNQKKNESHFPRIRITLNFWLAALVGPATPSSTRFETNADTKFNRSK
jgi:hypothetical protein